MKDLAPIATASILVIEDDPDILELIVHNMSAARFLVEAAETLGDARIALRRKNFDLLIVDVRLPDGNGMEFAQEVSKTSEIGIIVMTGSGDEVDRIIGLELGADDYINKPFHQRELVARARAVLRRGRKSNEDLEDQADEFRAHAIQFHGYALCKSNRSVIGMDGEPIDLTTLEFDVLAVLVDNKNVVLSRSDIYEHACLRTSNPSRAVDGLISRLRKKLFENDRPLLRIRTIHGRGYALTE